jgi:hypothetical protein
MKDVDFQFSTTPDGTHAGGTVWTTGITKNGTEGTDGAYIEVDIAKIFYSTDGTGIPAGETLYYFNKNASGYGPDENSPLEGSQVALANDGGVDGLTDPNADYLREFAIPDDIETSEEGIEIRPNVRYIEKEVYNESTLEMRNELAIGEDPPIDDGGGGADGGDAGGGGNAAATSGGGITRLKIDSSTQVTVETLAIQNLQSMNLFGQNVIAPIGAVAFSNDHTKMYLIAGTEFTTITLVPQLILKQVENYRRPVTTQFTATDLVTFPANSGPGALPGPVRFYTAIEVDKYNYIYVVCRSRYYRCTPSGQIITFIDGILLTLPMYHGKILC